MEEEDPLQRMAQSLRSENRLFDIVLKTDGGEIEAHRFVLVAYSDFFNEVLQGGNQFCNYLALEESGVSHAVLKILVDFMYSANMDLTPDFVLDVLDAATNLRIDKAVTYINQYYIKEDGTISDTKIIAQAKGPKTSSGKKRGRPRKADQENSEENPYKEKLSELNLDDLDQGQVDAIMQSQSGRARRKSSLRLAAVMQTVKGGDEADAGATVSKSPSKNKPLKTYSRVANQDAIIEVDIANVRVQDMEKVGEEMEKETNAAENYQEMQDDMKDETGGVDASVLKLECVSDNEEDEDMNTSNQYVQDTNESVTKTEDEAGKKPSAKRSFSDDEEDNDADSEKKKPYSIPSNTLEFLKRKKLLYKPLPGEGSARPDDNDDGCTRRYRKGGGLLKKYSDPNRPNIYVCPWENCTFTSRHSKNVYVHEKKHTGERPWKCDVCDKGFISKKHMILHQSVHSDKRPFSCTICGKTFRAQSGLDRHKLSHTGERPFKCDYDGCEAAFKDKVNLRKHVSLIHLHEKPFECDHPGCDYVACDQASVLRHQVRHKSLSERESEQCNICGKVLYGARSMQSHLLVHEGERQQCPFCEYSSVFKQALQAHCYRKHECDLEGNKVTRNYKCDQCDYATFWEHELKFHQAKHTGMRPFQCPICDYSTVLKGSLVKHMRLHTGEQPFKCSLCNKAYTNQSGLARHKRTHTGEKPHKCEICGKRYADLKTMRTHRYAHLNIKPFTCHLCSYTCTKKDVLIAHFRKMHGESTIPVEFKPKPMNKVMMRVTSGQTADEIIRNIAPSGQGDRQFLVINSDEMVEADSKFLVIQEDEVSTPIVEHMNQVQLNISPSFNMGQSHDLNSDKPENSGFEAKVLKISHSHPEDNNAGQISSMPEILESLRAQYPDLGNIEIQYQLVDNSNNDTGDLNPGVIGSGLQKDHMLQNLPTSMPEGFVLLTQPDGNLPNIANAPQSVSLLTNQHPLGNKLMTTAGGEHQTRFLISNVVESDPVSSNEIPQNQSIMGSGIQLSHPILQSHLSVKGVPKVTSRTPESLPDTWPSDLDTLVLDKEASLADTQVNEHSDLINASMKTNDQSKDAPNSSWTNNALSGSAENYKSDEIGQENTKPEEDKLNNGGAIHVSDSMERLITSESMQDSVLTTEQMQELSNQISTSHSGEEIVLHVRTDAAGARFVPEQVPDKMQVSENLPVPESLQVPAELNASGEFVITYIDPSEQKQSVV